jgi:hypothetical protein
MTGQQRGRLAALRIERRADDVRLDAAAADGADQPAFGADQHLGARGNGRRAAHASHGRERTRGPSPNQLSSRAPDIHPRKAKRYSTTRVPFIPE